MASHLKRQAGVADASYKAGTIELQGDKAQPFEIGKLVRFLKDEIGFSPIKRIEATVRGRVLHTPTGSELRVIGTGERLLLKNATAIRDGEQVLKGVIEIKGKGTLTLKPGSGQVEKTE